MLALPCSLLFTALVVLVICGERRQRRNVRRLEEYRRVNEEYSRQLEQLRAKQHDIKNQLLVINGMLKDGAVVKDEDFSSFLHCTQEQINEISLLLKLNDPALAMLFFTKYKQAQERGVELRLRCEVAALPGKLRCSRTDLVDVTGNLLDNAIEASASGGAVHFNLGEAQGRFYISVRNCGSIPDGADRLWQAGYSTKGTNRGYGLHNVRRIVKKHGGNMELMIDGDKIEFTIFLPLAA